ncbi:hypothetical protein ACG3JJ_07705 [Streptococcus parauberis]|nr:hypothetical protein [Streptococcus parauberis]
MGEKHDFIEKKTLKTGKLSRGNILMSLGLSILALVILFVTILCYQYTNTSIEGKWACNSLNQQLEEKFNDNIDAISQDIGIDVKKHITTPKLTMTVFHDNSKIVVNVKINRKSLSNEILKYYQASLKEALSKENVNIADLDPDTLKDMENELPTNSTIEQYIDDMIIEKVHEYGGHYDVRTGNVTIVGLKGRVNRFMNTITIEKINSKSKLFSKKSGYFDYIKNRDKLILKNHMSFQFKIIKSSN